MIWGNLTLNLIQENVYFTIQKQCSYRAGIARFLHDYLGKRKWHQIFKKHFFMFQNGRFGARSAGCSGWAISCGNAYKNRNSFLEILNRPDLEFVKKTLKKQGSAGCWSIEERCNPVAAICYTVWYVRPSCSTNAGTYSYVVSTRRYMHMRASLGKEKKEECRECKVSLNLVTLVFFMLTFW